jgi:hypothetical protein
MNKLIPGIIPGLARLLLAGWAMAAQAALGEDLCSPLLQHGIYDSFRELSDQASSQTIDREVCEAYNKLQSDKINGAAQATYGLFSGSASVGRDQLEVLGQNRCDRNFSTAAAKALSEKAGRFVSQAAVEAWRDCTTRLIASQTNGGLVVDTKFLGEDLGGTGVTIGLRYAQLPGGTPTSLRIADISVDGKMACSGPLWEKVQGGTKPVEGVKLTDSVQAFQCTRTIARTPFEYAGRLVLAEPVAITVYTGADTVLRKLALVPAYPPLIPYGVGDVVTSMLSPEDFAKAHGPGWVLAEGQSAQGTAWARLTRKLNVPDLRGVFLRGKNHKRSDKTGNPSGDLPLGAYQSDAFQKHRHNLDPRTLNYDGSGSHSLDVREGTTLGRTSETEFAGDQSETRPRSVTINFFIKVD